MSQRLRLTRRPVAAISQDAHRQLRLFCEDSGLTEGEALTFLLENLRGIINEDTLSHRLKAFKSNKEAR